MPRNITFPFRQSIEAPASDEILLCFATLTHPQLSVPVRVAADVVDYIYGDNRFYGIPFSFQLLTDSDRVASAQIKMQNVDQIIGNIVKKMRTTWPRLKLEVLAASDFGPASIVDGRKTRQPLGTPIVEYSADHLRIVAVKGDVVAVEGTITGIDLSREPYPTPRATKSRLPSLFR